MSQSVRAHAHHIISDLLSKKYINFSQQEENISYFLVIVAEGGREMI